uniref:Uncharacterized protein n=1 Tax=Anguilla anguilla TaxID=7936 RepID=A0A0E9URS9_ANGAN
MQSLLMVPTVFCVPLRDVSALVLLSNRCCVAIEYLLTVVN